MIYVDADDFCEDNHDFETLWWIKERNPGFRITLFTIPARCSLPWLRSMQSVDWFRLCPHGWGHRTSRECERWDYDVSVGYLKAMEGLGFHRGFKAPGWQISDGMYRALLERGWWVADQAYNDGRRPSGLRYFLPGPHHFHIMADKRGRMDNGIHLYKQALADRVEEEHGFIGD